MNNVVYKKGRKREYNGTKNSAWNSFLKNYVVKFVFLIVSIYLVYNIYHSIEITIAKLNISKEANKEVNELRVKNLELELTLNDMKSDDYLEAQARDRLNYSGENEFVFVIPDNTLEKAKESVNEILYGTEEVVNESTFTTWYKFFKNGI